MIETKRVILVSGIGKSWKNWKSWKNRNYWNCKVSVEFILTLSDSQNLNLVRKSGLWNSELRCRPVRSGYPPFARRQRGLDDFSFFTLLVSR